MDADAKRRWRGEGGGSRGVGSNRTPADNGGGGSKIDKILRTSFMDGPSESFGFSWYFNSETYDTLNTNSAVKHHIKH